MTDEPEQATPPSEQPEEQTAETLEYREISPDELQEILEQHRKWVKTEGKEGKQASLDNANLQEAELWEANLQKAHLVQANLQKAFLFQANLQEAELGQANLQKAYLGQANLQKAHLVQANLQEAYRYQANLEKADLRGANLAGAKNLTQAQLNHACVDEKTILPEGLTRPEPCSEDDLGHK